jgi:hypothetical protein
MIHQKKKHPLKPKKLKLKSVKRVDIENEKSNNNCRVGR